MGNEPRTPSAWTEFLGLHRYEVFDRFHPDAACWEGLATSQIHALDRYATSMGYAGYTAILEDAVADQGAVDELCIADGKVWAVFENTELTARRVS